MQPSPWLYSFLKSFEQFRPTAYAVTAQERARGIWTIGYGHTHGVKEGDTCTMEEAVELLHADVQKTVDEMCNLVHVRLSQPQFDALVSLVFNIGATNFATSTLLKLLNAGDIAGASAEFPKWNLQKGEVLDGLTKRRAAERARFDELLAA